jgi:hypothetical protein
MFLGIASLSVNLLVIVFPFSFFFFVFRTPSLRFLLHKLSSGFPLTLGNIQRGLLLDNPLADEEHQDE